MHATSLTFSQSFPTLQLTQPTYFVQTFLNSEHKSGTDPYFLYRSGERETNALQWKQNKRTYHSLSQKVSSQDQTCRSFLDARELDYYFTSRTHRNSVGRCSCQWGPSPLPFSSPNSPSQSLRSQSSVCCLETHCFVFLGGVDRPGPANRIYI